MSARQVRRMLLQLFGAEQFTAERRLSEGSRVIPEGSGTRSHGLAAHPEHVRVLPIGTNPGLAPVQAPGSVRRIPATQASDLPALDDPDQDNHDRHNEQDVNESPHRVGGNQPQQPGNEENDGQCVEHEVLRVEVVDACRSGAGKTPVASATPCLIPRARDVPRGVKQRPPRKQTALNRRRIATAVVRHLLSKGLVGNECRGPSGGRLAPGSQERMAGIASCTRRCSLWTPREPPAANHLSAAAIQSRSLLDVRRTNGRCSPLPHLAGSAVAEPLATAASALSRDCTRTGFVRCATKPADRLRAMSCAMP